MNLKPIRPATQSKNDIVRCCNELCDRVRELELLQSTTLRIVHTPNGTSVEVKDTKAVDPCFAYD